MIDVAGLGWLNYDPNGPDEWRDKTSGADRRTAMATTNLLDSEAAQIASDPAIDGYLIEHPTLRDLLPRICERARSEFGRGVELTLELYRDPEIDDRYLTLLVRQPQYEANIVERLDQLAAQFADELDQCTGDLLVTTDFRPAR